MSTIKYKEYQAVIEYDDGAFFVKVLHIDDLLIAQFDRASDAQAVLKDLVDGYLANCESAGRQPSKPFKGSFNVRIAPELHRRAAMTAADDNQSLNAWISTAISEKLECTRFSDRIHQVISAQQVVTVWGVGQHNSDAYGVLRRPSAFSGQSVEYKAIIADLQRTKVRRLNG